MEHLRFGTDRPLDLVIACHGGWPQKVEGNYPGTQWPDFRGESRLERLATDRTAVVMPQAPGSLWSLYRMRDVDMLTGIVLQYHFRLERLFLFGHSLGATFVLRAMRYLRPAGVVICSGVTRPLENWWDWTPRQGPVRSLVFYGVQERDRNRNQARKIRDLLTPLGETELHQHDGAHHWPKTRGASGDWNNYVCAYFDLR